MKENSKSDILWKQSGGLQQTDDGAENMRLLVLILSLHFLHFNEHSRWTWVSRYQNVSVLDFIEAKDTGGGGDNCSIKLAKLQSNGHHQQTNTQLFTGQMPFLSPNQQCQEYWREKVSRSTDLITPSSPGAFQLLSLTTEGFSFTLREGCQACP